MRLSKNLPKFLWAETVNMAVYILNRPRPSQVQDKTPYELITGKSVHVKNLRVFGTPCFVHVSNIEEYRIWLKSSNQIIRRLIELMLAEIDEPKSFSQAVNSSNKQHWKKAMEEEIASLKENSTWSLVELPAGCKAISNRWIYRVKRNAEGEISRYKARLVVRGFSQREGIDFNETFSPVARFDTIRTVLSIAANEGLELAQFDVKTAFLNGVIEENIYMDQPEGFEDDTDRQSVAGMFHRISGNEKLIVVLYVDDGLIAATSKAIICELLSNLEDKFRITVESFGSFLNMLTSRQDDGSIFISQKAYAESVLKRFNMEDANPVSTAIEKCQLMEEADEELTDVPYREAVGCLMYLAVATRLDIAYAVNYASQFLEKPGQQHWAIIKQIFKYIKGTIGLEIRYSAAWKTGVLEAYSDAGYASDTTTRKSISGIVLKYSGEAIVWASRRQDCVSLSTTEAEYIASSEAAKDIVWLTHLFNEISPLKNKPVLLVNNASAIKLAKNHIFHRRPKHIEVRFHFVRECYQKKLLNIKHVTSSDQMADILTKPIPQVLYERLRKLLGVLEH
ncbi:retrovirus-related pol polyprotein from transposon tnt 1-94 [Lasius niger]|uniref:Retrovirus-related pol polyprotein from transposon tnt 1-94 n=1 Tax=Lasius niger TaxID=67767 RepID=A0A0J7K9Z2_LASNI|nr:retrovirus-related pol polyprotein from transposon tnt 1-94 [Lasius niger]